MVDRSLMGLAADRGVTICFADLDGADGLWVPEERTILVSRRLSEERVNEVIEHELAHVAIDDQHAALDAGVSERPGRTTPAWLSQRWAAPALSVAAFVALVGGVTAGLAAARPEGGQREILNPTQQPSSATSSGVLRPTTSISPYRADDGSIKYKTVTVMPTATPSLPSGSVPATRPAPVNTTSTRKSGTSGPPIDPIGTTTAQPITTPPPTPTPTVEPTTPDASPSSPAVASAPIGGAPSS